MDVWPVSLPQVLNRDGYSSGFADGRIRSSVDTGPAKVRRRSSAMPRPLSGTITVTAAQLATLRTFVDATLLSGSLPFTFPSPEGGSALTVRFAKDLPAWAPDGFARWSVSLQLEVLP